MTFPPLDTRFVGQSLIYFPETDSTNDRAWAALADFPANGTCFVTDYQSKGRGQRNNKWLSLPGQNLLFSVLLYPTFLSIDQIFQLTKITALAVRQTVQEFLPQHLCSIKWPNDILLNYKKVAGILIENQFSGSTILASVLGIGLNLNQTTFEHNATYQPTSFFLETKQEFDRAKVFAKLLKNIELWYEHLQNNRTLVNREYLTHLLGFQEKRSYQNNTGEFEGYIIGVETNGRLAIQIQNTVRYFEFKEIEFVL